jgi:hypothetical protein
VVNKRGNNDNVRKRIAESRVMHVEFKSIL